MARSHNHLLLCDNCGKGPVTHSKSVEASVGELPNIVIQRQKIRPIFCSEACYNKAKRRHRKLGPDEYLKMGRVKTMSKIPLSQVDVPSSLRQLFAFRASMFGYDQPYDKEILPVLVSANLGHPPDGTVTACPESVCVPLLLLFDSLVPTKERCQSLEDVPFNVFVQMIHYYHLYINKGNTQLDEKTIARRISSRKRDVLQSSALREAITKFAERRVTDFCWPRTWEQAEQDANHIALSDESWADFLLRTSDQNTRKDGGDMSAETLESAISQQLTQQEMSLECLMGDVRSLFDSVGSEASKESRGTSSSQTQTLTFTTDQVMDALASRGINRGSKRNLKMALRLFEDDFSEVVDGTRLWDFCEDFVSKIRDNEEIKARRKKEEKAKREEEKAKREEEKAKPKPKPSRPKKVSSKKRVKRGPGRPVSLRPVTQSEAYLEIKNQIDELRKKMETIQKDEAKDQLRNVPPKTLLNSVISTFGKTDELTEAILGVLDEDECVSLYNGFVEDEG